MKNIRSIPLLLLSLLILVGLSGCGTDYTNCFSFEPAEVVTDLRANEIAINYTIMLTLKTQAMKLCPHM